MEKYFFRIIGIVDPTNTVPVKYMLNSITIDFGGYTLVMKEISTASNTQTNDFFKICIRVIQDRNLSFSNVY